MGSFFIVIIWAAISAFRSHSFSSSHALALAKEKRVPLKSGCGFVPLQKYCTTHQNQLNNESRHISHRRPSR